MSRPDYAGWTFHQLWAAKIEAEDFRAAAERRLRAIEKEIKRRELVEELAASKNRDAV